MTRKLSNISLKFVGEADFQAHVLQTKGAVLVAFWAPWSKPCHVIEPVLQEVAEICAGKVEIVKVNADDHPNLSLRFGVQHIPTLLFFEGGQLHGHLVGTASKDAILNVMSLGGETGSGSDSSIEGGNL